MMKKQMMIGVCVALAAGLSSLGAAEMKHADLEKALHDSSATAKTKMEAIEKYVSHVEEKASDLTRKEESMAAADVKKVTDETWTKMHGYFMGEDLKRMKLYPAEGSTKTEEFYFYDNKPVFVFVEENGVGKENHDEKALGSKYFFVDGKLIAAMSEDGKSMDVDGAEAEKMSSKLQKEAKAFHGMLK